MAGLNTAIGVGNGLYPRWLKQLNEAGVIPPNTRRIIIDMDLEEVVRVYYECIADERMFTVDLANVVKGADVIGVADCKKGKGEDVT